MRVSRHRLLVYALSLFLIIGLSTAAFADDIYIEDQSTFHNYIDASALHGSIDMKSLGILIYSAVHSDIDPKLGEHINKKFLTIKLGVTFKDYTSDKNGIAPVPIEIDLDRIIYQFKATLAF